MLGCTSLRKNRNNPLGEGKVRLTGFLALAVVGLVPGIAAAADISVERGKQISIIGGCNDCHTAGYNESGGVIDPAKALMGTSVGWMGPWGTTYPKNLRITVSDKTEDEFVKFAKTFQTRPPMPWYNVHAIDESDIRSLYQYIKSLGAAGAQVPAALDPGEMPKTPYTVAAPPTMPKG
jgi:mono/diheme cytochrome c family protein